MKFNRDNEKHNLKTKTTQKRKTPNPNTHRGCDVRIGCFINQADFVR